MADDRETRDLAEHGVNVINIQGEKYSSKILLASAKVSSIKNILSKYDLSIKSFPEMVNLVKDIDLSLKDTKIHWENNKDEERLSVQLDELEKLILAFYEFYGKLSSES